MALSKNPNAKKGSADAKKRARILADEGGFLDEGGSPFTCWSLITFFNALESMLASSGLNLVEIFPRMSFRAADDEESKDRLLI